MKTRSYVKSGDLHPRKGKEERLRRKRKMEKVGLSFLRKTEEDRAKKELRLGREEAS